MSTCESCGERFGEVVGQCPRCHVYCTDGLIELLRHAQPEVRARAAADMFFLVPSEPVAAALAGAFSDPDVRVRRAAGVSLFICAAKAGAVIPLLISALEDPDRLVRRAAAASLWVLGPAAKAALPKLTELRAHEDLKLRSWAAQVENAIQRQQRV